MAFSNVFDSSLIDYSKDFENDDRKINFINEFNKNLEDVICNYVESGFEIKLNEEYHKLDVMGLLEDYIKDMTTKTLKSGLEQLVIENIYYTDIDSDFWTEHKKEAEEFFGVKVPDFVVAYEWDEKDVDKLEILYRNYINNVDLKALRNKIWNDSINTTIEILKTKLIK